MRQNPKLHNPPATPEITCQFQNRRRIALRQNPPGTVLSFEAMPSPVRLQNLRVEGNGNGVLTGIPSQCRINGDNIKLEVYRAGYVGSVGRHG